MASSIFLTCASALLVFVVMSSGVAAERKNWVLLIAGSASYGNYRHQADICHAYQIAHKNGIPDEQIVVMMYDDIANNEDNPVPGNIINRPGGPNVYPGVPKDYIGDDVNAKTFLAVLQGDREKVKNLLGREGKVIASGPDDYVFVYFADHGGTGILGMPSPPYLRARPLNAALQKMNAAKKFSKLVFYVEACESGSIFENILPKDINVYVTTAANADESSYGCYCPPYDDNRGSCLGDAYSVNWMEDTDAADLHTETLEQQYQIVKRKTNMSHVMQFGDTSFTNLPLEQFLANGKVFPNQINEQRAFVPKKNVPTDMAGILSLQSLVVSPHPRHVARRTEIKKNLQAQLWMKAQTTEIFTNIAKRVYTGKDMFFTLDRHTEVRNWDCYENATDRLFDLCPRIAPYRNDFVLRKMNVLANLCNSQTGKEVLSAIEHVVVTSPLCY
ncbi:vacuolar-processing enzyme [Elysia marginata]|uniref:Hemoglobinase n=1 Tax=Elysia marginata TaxID=1093978 RepID=A0AAV4FV43_9GAST|nr:vacuolar-processing enzyme [Elysia marginata]